ncbi:MAG: hypothetical protein ACE5EI_09805 [Thermodesulfobacteriota bacterium]
MARTIIRRTASATAGAGKARGAGALRGQDVKSRRNLRDMGFFYTAVISFSALFVLISVILWTRLMVVNIGYDISRTNAERGRLIEKNKRLTLELMALKSPERIERIAAGRLGLVYPSGSQIIEVR